MYNYPKYMIYNSFMGSKPPFKVGVGLGEFLWIDFLSCWNRVFIHSLRRGCV